MQNLNTARSRQIADALAARNERAQWEEFIGSMLAKLELPLEKRAQAEKRYKDLARHVSKKLGIGEHDAHVVVQGSMRTQTTVAGYGREKFDLDIVVKLCGPKFEGLQHSEKFFSDFGASLQGIEDAGEPQPKSRCWRLQYPGESFYFDVTPAVPLSEGITGTHLRVRDPKTVWSPSNPEEFADWFCDIANKRFPFQLRLAQRLSFEAKTTVDPIPNGKVGLDDVLRRVVQLLKLHRDGYYRPLSEVRQEAKPISVILVTLAAQAYDEMVTRQPNGFDSAIEVALEVVDRMPRHILGGPAGVHVDNPAMPKHRGENFADRWNSDGGVRQREFSLWHGQVTNDLQALFAEKYSSAAESRIRSMFGQAGVDSWKGSLPKPNVLSSLLATAPAQAQPSAPRPTGSRSTLA